MVTVGAALGAPASSLAARCAGCDLGVSLHAATPRVTTSGRVELWCAPCARGERAPSVAAVEPPVDDAPAPRARSRRWLTGAAVGATALAATLLATGATGAPRARDAAASVAAAAATTIDGSAATRGALVPGAAGVVDVPAPDSDAPEHASVGTDDGLVAHEPALEPAAPRRPIPPIPLRDGEPLDEWMPTLRDWSHPVPGTSELIPTRATRFFGAERDGTDRPECGGGHCGVDLGGVPGQAVVAVAWGTVSKIQRDPDRRGGRYVRIEHPDFVFSSYFHLDRIAPDLAIGDEVEPGTPLGSLGTSGINVSTPHLHFSLELPTAGGATVFVDPSPYLARASVVPRTAALDAVVAPPGE